MCFLNYFIVMSIKCILSMYFNYVCTHTKYNNKVSKIGLLGLLYKYILHCNVILCCQQ